MKHATKTISARLPMNIYEELKEELAETGISCMNDLYIMKILADKENLRTIKELQETIKLLREEIDGLKKEKEQPLDFAAKYISNKWLRK